jgi:hypothetical protein
VIVHLTTKQLAATRAALDEFGLGWAREHWLAEPGLSYGHTDTYECQMPAIGWLRSMNCLVQLTVGPLGGNRQGTRGPAVSARNRIAEALSTYAAHPALFGVGLPGYHTDAFPVWEAPGVEKPGRLYDIFPIVGAQFMHLIPYRDGGFTLWEAQLVIPLGHASCSVLDLEEHLRFADRGALPGDRESVAASSPREAQPGP